MAAVRRPRRAELSQHFLRRSALAASLVDQASIRRSDLVIEVGAGTGALTSALATRAGRVLAVELDSLLARELEVRFAAEQRVEVVHADFLRFVLPREPVRLFGNIPYASTSEIVRRATAHASVVDGHFVVQREAADRLAGAPLADESLWSLRLKPWWHVEVVRHLRRTDFDPPPAVDSVMLWLARRTPPLVPDSERAAYEQFLSRAIGRARTAHDALGVLFTREQRRRLIEDLRVNPRGAPTSIRFEQWLALFRFRRWQADR